MYRLNVSYKLFYITLNEVWLFKVIQVSPVHAANLVANIGNTAYGVDVITGPVYKRYPNMVIIIPADVIATDWCLSWTFSILLLVKWRHSK